jgi:predicted nucleotidyltransferase
VRVQRARKVILFGSVARSDADSTSDLDLVIVADTTRPFFER